jgi:hypothetical protein
VEPCGRCGRPVALALDGTGGVADVGRVALMVEVVHRDSVWQVNRFNTMFIKLLSYGLLKDKNIPTIMISSRLPLRSISSSLERRADSSVRLRVRATHSSWTTPSASGARMYADCAGPGTSKTADDVCTCAGDEGLVD